MTTDGLRLLEKSVKNSKPAITLRELKCLCEGNTALEECLKEFIGSSLRYAETVCQFQRIILETGGVDSEEKVLAEIDSVRGRVHNALIADMKILVRMMRKSGIDCAWYDRVGDHRSRQGRFALILAFEKISS